MGRVSKAQRLHLEKLKVWQDNRKRFFDADERLLKSLRKTFGRGIGSRYKVIKHGKT